jgi:glycosyltransferase involved in cell wall biosynthesis
MKIGFVHKGYPEVRNIIAPWKSVKVSLVKIIDIYKLLDFLCFKIFGKTKSALHNKLFTLNSNFGDGVHLFNGIWLNASKPWVVTFESILPRMAKSNKEEKLLIEKLANEKCQAIIAMSKSNYELQKQFIETKYPVLKDNLFSKLKQAYPPQAIIENISFENTDKLRLLFVGTDFYRKGGHVALRAFVACFKNNIEVELTIVSSLQQGFISDYTELNEIWVKSQLKEQPNVHWINGADNKQVIDLMKKSDVILLPTFSDTFGYTAIEGMACGCVPVVSNIRVLPEIVNEDTGYVIHAKVNKQGNLDEDILIENQATEMINQLSSVYQDIWGEWNNNSLKETKKQAQKWISQNCDPAEYIAKLKTWMFHD